MQLYFEHFLVKFYKSSKLSFMVWLKHEGVCVDILVNLVLH